MTPVLHRIPGIGTNLGKKTRIRRRGGGEEGKRKRRRRKNEKVEKMKEEVEE